MDSSSWATCTPRDYHGGEGFFTRDSGLLSRGFAAIGCESRAIMTGAKREDDADGLLRVSARELGDWRFWRDLRVDGVVLYAWGRPRYLGVARAIRRAGVFLVLNQDSAGLVSPLAYPVDWLRGQFLGSGRGQDLSAWITFAGRVVRAFSTGLFLTDPLRAWHFRQGDVISAVSPVAAERYRKLCRIYGGRRLADKVKMIPHPVSPDYQYPAGGLGKEDLVLSVGRWDDHNQKRPDLLARTIGEVLGKRENTRFEIFGPPGSVLPKWLESLGPDERARVRLAGAVPQSELVAAMRRARVFLSSSSYEGGQIAAMEALCSGCGFVGCAGGMLACNDWFTEEFPECLASTPERLGECLLRELTAWDEARRDPVATSRRWTERVHAPQVAMSILKLAESSRLP